MWGAQASGSLLHPWRAAHEFTDQAQPLPSEPVIDKVSFGACDNTKLEDLLRQNNVDHIVMCGVTTQCRVHSTLQDAVIAATGV
jgi:nicotinamidase-related amidase